MTTNCDQNYESISKTTKFSDFCKVCDKIESKVKTKDKREVLKKFINWWKTNQKDSNDCIYPAIRLLCPFKDIKTLSPIDDTNGETSAEPTDQTGDQSLGRSAYGLKIDKLRQKYIKILNLSRESDDAKKLLNFNRDNESKDFGNVLFEIMSRRSRVIDGRLTLDDVNRSLDRISKSYEESRVIDAEEVLTQLINNTTALENKWLVRIILKDMHLGIGDTSILNTYHSDAKEYYETIHNLYKVCIDLSDPEIPLSVKCVQLFAPFSPMLSERVKLNSINRKLKDNKFFIELKYDGERFQIHKRLNQLKYFSRNCNDFSDAFNQTLTPFISNGFDQSVVDCILDGEMLGYDRHNCRPILKSEKDFDVKRIKSDETERHPFYVIFDILYLNGEVLTGKPLEERVKLLQSIVKPIDSRLKMAERKCAETKEEIIEALNAAIDRCDEGIIVKRLDSVYKLNVRNGGWIKLKPDYIDGLMDELDLLIVGGSYGNRGGISHFFMAVKATEDDNPNKFFSVCRVGTGYSNEELKQLQNQLKTYWKPFDKKKCPQFLQLGRLKPDVWIEPKNSVVLQIKAAEIMDSSGEYDMNYTLRFPRVTKKRDDKEWHQCMSLEELDQMKAKGSLVSSFAFDDNEEPERKKRKQMERPMISSLNRLADVSDVSVKTLVFNGHEFCVTPFKEPSLKQSLEKLIVENGGQFTGHPMPGKTFCIIAQNCDTIAVKRYINSNKYNVIKDDWIHRCIQKNKLLDWTPNEVLCLTNESKNKISQQFDRFGDSYTEPIYELELKELFEKMTDLSDIRLLSNPEIADIEFEYWPNERDFSFFRTLKVFVDNHESNDRLLVKFIESRLRFYGATVVHNSDENPSHIVVLSPQRSDYFKRINRRNVKKFHIVCEDWVEKCIKAKDVLEFVDLSFGD